MQNVVTVDTSFWSVNIFLSIFAVQTLTVDIVTENVAATLSKMYSGHY